MSLSRLSLPGGMARAIADHLERDAQELEASHFHPRFGRVTLAAIRREIDRCRRWARLLRGGRVR